MTASAPLLHAIDGQAATSWLEGTPMNPTAATPEPLPTIDGFPYLHAGCAALISGPTGGGRSSLAQACAYDAGRLGVRVAYLGSEVTEAEFNARARDLAERRDDALDAKLAAELANVRYLPLTPTIVHAWQHPDEWVREAAARYDVLIADPISALASATGLDFDKSNADWVRFYNRLVQPLVERGVAVVLLDNIGHAPESSKRAKGASAKQDLADLTFSCRLRARPLGLIITVQKVRSVRAAFGHGAQWVFDRETQRIDIVEPDHGDIWRPTAIMERVSRLLEDQSPLGKNEIRAEIPSKAENVDAAIRALIADGHVHSEPAERGKKQLHHLLKPYRDPVSPTESEPRPGHGMETESDRVPPPKGGTRSQDSVPSTTQAAAPSPDDAQGELDRVAEKFPDLEGGT